MREEQCEYCQVVFIMKNMKEHQETDCPMFPVPCPQKCRGPKVRRSEIDEHFKSCPNTILSCEFKYLGCHSDVKRKDVSRHMKNAAVEHTMFLKRRLASLTNYLLTKDSALKDLLNPAPVEQGKGKDSNSKMETE